MNAILLALLVTAPPAASGPGAPPAPGAGPGGVATPEDVRAYCEYSRATASSESLRLLLPDLVATYGWTHGTEQITGVGIADALIPMVTVGARYDLAQLARGLAVRRLGRAECDRYRVDSALRTFADHHAPAVARRALEARLAVLEAALPRAAELLQGARDAVHGGSATMAELNALELRVDGVRALADRTRRDLAALPAEGPATPQPLGELLARRHELEARVVELEGAVRRTKAWELSFRGGYEKVLDDADTRIPLYGLFTLSVNPAYLFQGADDARAARARSAWLGADLDGIDQRVRQAQRELADEAAADRRRLAELAVVTEDLEVRLREAEAIKSDRLQRYRDHLWLDLLQARAGAAYLRAHLDDASALAGDAAEPR